MVLSIKRIQGNNIDFLCTNERDQSIVLSGTKNAVSPMESVAMAAAACSAIDIELILLKMKQDFTSIEVEIVAQKVVDEIPAVFKSIELFYSIVGQNIKPDKAQSAVELSVEKYCSVIHMLQKTVTISYKFEIIEL